MKSQVSIIICLIITQAWLYASDKPSFFLLLADDMTWSDCEPYGNEEVKTPNMRKLAEQGISLDGMFTSTAMCAPTRQQLYTGLFPIRNGAYPNHSKVHKGVRSLPHHLISLGYRVGLIGKQHYGPSASFPFEYLGGNTKNYSKIKQFISRDSDQPYCLIVCSNSPHMPVTEGDASVYPPASLRVPPNLIQSPSTQIFLSKYYAEITDLDTELGECIKLVDDSYKAENTLFMFTSEQGMTLPFGGKWTCYDSGLKTAFIARWPKHIQPQTRSAALTQYVDVVPTLIEAAGGDPAKYEVGITDAESSMKFDGKSFLKVLTGTQAKHREFVYGVHTTLGILHGSVYPIRSIRNDRFKLICNLNHQGKFQNAYTKSEGTEGKYYQEYTIPLIETAAKNKNIATRLALFQSRPPEEFYDLKNDPYELNNLADFAEHKAVKDQMRMQLAAWMKQQGDSGIDTEKKAKPRKSPKAKKQKK